MRLLICTQKVAEDDAVLGFMHGWILHFAAACDLVTVITLEEGKHTLPQNVSVYSLGKETGESRLKYVRNFYRSVSHLRGSYDAVLVHMNPEYMILGGLLWRMQGVPTALWYNHRMGGLRARLGILLAKKVFFTSPFAFASRFKKAQRMPAGIDTDQFKPGSVPRAARSVLSLGRVDRVKRVEVIISALQKLAAEGTLFVAHFYGGPTTKDQGYFEEMQKMAEKLVKKGLLRWFPPVPNARAAAIFNEHSVFINATPTGSFDKSVLESMACETPVLSGNPSFRGLLPEELLFNASDSAELAEKLEALLSKSEEELRSLGRQLRERVVREQSLALLVPRVLAVLQRA
ncbi:MAG TPA: glycosyltransferase family 4 protein [Candidatus Paceibacterota bacterium]